MNKFLIGDFVTCPSYPELYPLGIVMEIDSKPDAVPVVYRVLWLNSDRLYWFAYWDLAIATNEVRG